MVEGLASHFTEKRAENVPEAAATTTAMCIKPPSPETDGQGSKLLAETPLLPALAPPLGQARGDAGTFLASSSSGHPEAGPEQEVQVADGQVPCRATAGLPSALPPVPAA